MVHNKAALLVGLLAVVACIAYTTHEIDRLTKELAKPKNCTAEQAEAFSQGAHYAAGKATSVVAELIADKCATTGAVTIQGTKYFCKPIKEM